jgi:uncharacterized membrane protein
VNPLMPIHIIGGSIALLAGFAVLLLRKGTDSHARIGTVFFVGMLVLAGTGAVMAALKPERGTMIIGLLSCYLVATSWATVRGDGRARGFERAGFGFALVLAGTMLGFGLAGLAAENGRFDSLPAAVHFPFALLAGLAAALDLNFILRRQLSAKQRIARHLWRMCAALLIAAFSFFLGQQKNMPEAIQGSPLLYLPPLIALVVMIFWIFRVRFGRKLPIGRRRRRASAVLTPALAAE